MARLRSGPPGPRHRIAVIDDDRDLLRSTLELLRWEGHEAEGDQRPEDGVQRVRAWRPDLVLLDYHMPGATGADVVRHIRAFDPLVQVLLVTGYSSEHPARTLLAELDIQGYHDKNDGPARLLVHVDAALKHHRLLTRLDGQRRGLRRILDVLPEISRLQPPDELFRTALRHAADLAGGSGDGLIATANNGLFVLSDANEGISVRAGTGRFAGLDRLSQLAAPVDAVVRDGLGLDAPSVHPLGFVTIPLRTRHGDRGCMIVEGRDLAQDAVEICSIYAHQVVQALENVTLHERATTDPLTRLFNRGFGEQRLREVLALAGRQGGPTSVALADVDHFKAVNDTYGHAAGDLALRAVGQALKGACRVSDVLARFGGEEFLVVLPGTGGASAGTVAEGLRAAVEGIRFEFAGRRVPLTASFGVATARGDEPADDLVRRADAALYRAKAAGRNRIRGDDAERLAA